MYDLHNDFTLQEFGVLPLPEQSLNQVLLFITSTRRQPFIMLGVVGLSLWQHHRIAFGDVIVIVSLYLPHIVNFISSCLVIKLTFACHLVVVK